MNAHRMFGLADRFYDRTYNSFYVILAVNFSINNSVSGYSIKL